MASSGQGRRRFDVRRVDLNLLVSLHYLLQEAQVTAAAERMSVSQPSMSASLARLRRLLDDPLLVRAGRRLVLTPYAEGLRDQVADILREIELTLSTRPTFDPATESRHFVISATDYITLVLLKSLVSELSASTKVHIEVQPVTASHLDDLRNNRIDMIITPREVLGDVPDLLSATLFRDRFVGVASRHNTSIDNLTPELFSTLPYIAYRSDGKRSNVDGQFDRLGVARNVQMTSENFVVVPLVVTSSDFIAMIHERLGRMMMESLQLRLFEPPVALRPVTQAVFWHPRRIDDPAHRWLRERIVRMGRALQ
jgi:DNA-binding transcriptional LysR family regulator